MFNAMHHFKKGEHLYLRGRRELENGSQQKYIADSQAVSLTALAPCMRHITTPSTSLMVIITWGLISHYLANIVDSETRLVGIIIPVMLKMSDFTV